MTGDGSGNRTRSRFDSLLLSRSGGLPGQSSAATLLSTHDKKGKLLRTPPESEGEKEMDSIKLIFKPYKVRLSYWTVLMRPQTGR